MIKEISGVHLASDCITPPQLFRELVAAEENFREPEDGVVLSHKSLSIWSEEFSVFLGNNNPDMIVALTDLFDCPSQWTYSTKTKGSDDLSNAFLNICGAIPPRILQSKLTQDAVGGGLLSRIMFVVGYGKEKYVPLPFPSQEEIEIYENLKYDLAGISQMAGSFRFTERAIERYTQWYMNPANSNALDGEQFVGYNERRSLHLRKLCMIVSASRTSKRIINEEDFDRAVAILERTEKEMPNAFFGLGRGFHAQTMADVISYFQQHRRLSWRDLVERFKLDTVPDELSKLVQMLVSTGRVKQEYSTSGTTYYEIQPKADEVSKETYLDETIFSKTTDAKEEKK
jgi:hypothetical protein